MIVGILWLLLSVVIAAMAWWRGRSPVAWLLVSIFMSPIVGFLLIQGLGENTNAVDARRLDSSDYKQCPHCGRSTPVESAICQACGRVIGDYSQQIETAR